MTTREGIVEIETGAGLPEAFVRSMMSRMKTIGDVSPSLFTSPDRRLTVPSFTCAHCSSTVIIGPNAKLERPRCNRCQKSLCRECATHLLVTNECRNMLQRIERALESAARGREVKPALIIATR
jgi:hypothetical protein